MKLIERALKHEPLELGGGGNAAHERESRKAIAAEAAAQGGRGGDEEVGGAGGGGGPASAADAEAEATLEQAAAAVAAAPAASRVSLLDSPAGRGAHAWATQGDAPSPSDLHAYLGYHSARAIEKPGAEHCTLCASDGAKLPAYHVDTKTCPYCFSPPTMTRLVSAVAPDVVTASLFYRPSTMLSWARNENASVTVGTAHNEKTNPFVGTRPSRRYVEYGSGEDGKKRYNFSWCVMPGSTDSEGKQKKMESFSKLTPVIRYGGRSQLVAALAFQAETFRVLCWLRSPQENARFCPDPPRMPSDDHYEKQLKANNSEVSLTSSEVKPAPYAALNGPHAFDKHPPRVLADDPRGREAARHPSSLVPDTGLQRCMDGLLHRNRTYATSVLMSNRVVCTPPFRLYNDTLQANVGALTQHCMLVAESICACADVPGIRNQQEAFSGHGKAPENTVRCESDEVARAFDAPVAAVDVCV